MWDPHTKRLEDRDYGLKIQFNENEKFYKEFIKTYPYNWKGVEKMKELKGETRIYPISARKEVDADPKVLEALEGSVRKWTEILGGGKDRGTENCPLCKISSGCGSCIVTQKPEIDGCDSTPYGRWSDHLDGVHNTTDFPKIIECPACASIAWEELSFLRNLLVEYKTKKSTLPEIQYYAGDHIHIKGPGKIDYNYVLCCIGSSLIGLIEVDHGYRWGGKSISSHLDILSEDEFNYLFPQGSGTDYTYKVTIVKHSSRRQRQL